LAFCLSKYVKKEEARIARNWNCVAELATHHKFVFLLQS